MWNQTNLFGKVLEIPVELKTVCCEVCYNAAEEKCDCKCHGAYHGLGRLNTRAISPFSRMTECRVIIRNVFKQKGIRF